MTKRLFLGIPVPLKISEGITAYTSALADENLRLVKPENHHITINFFGEQDKEKLPFITEAIQTIADETKPFTLHFEEMLYAPPKRQPSMIWARYQSSEQFTELVKRTEDAVKEIVPFADRRNGHVPIPHITLARLKHLSLDTLPPIQLDPIEVKTAALFESKRTENGLEYEILTAYSLT